MRSLATLAADALAALTLGSAASGQASPSSQLPRLAVATAGSDANPCNAERALRVGRPGQVVEVASGTYPSQTIPLDGTKTLDDMVFQPVAGGAVTLSGPLNVYGRHVESRDMRLSTGWYARQGADDVTFYDVSARTFSIGSARHVSILGGRSDRGKRWAQLHGLLAPGETERA